MSRKYIFCVVKRHDTQVKSRNALKFLRFIQNTKRKFMHNCELIFLKCSATM